MCVQDEVLAVCKRIVVPVEDLVRWACPEPVAWRNQTPPGSGSPEPDLPREDQGSTGSTAEPTGGTAAEPTGQTLGDQSSTGTTAEPTSQTLVDQGSSTTAEPAGGTTAEPTSLPIGDQGSGTTAEPTGPPLGDQAGSTTAEPTGGTTAEPTGGTTAEPSGPPPGDQNNGEARRYWRRGRRNQTPGPFCFALPLICRLYVLPGRLSSSLIQLKIPEEAEDGLEGVGR